MAMKNDPLAVDAGELHPNKIPDFLAPCHSLSLDNQSLVGECATVTGLFPHNLQTGALYFGPIFDVDTRHLGNSHADIPVMSCYYPTVDLNKLSPPLYSCAEDEELPLNTHTVGPCSSPTLQSRYLQVVHGIFSDVANYALEGRSSATSIQRAFVVAGEDGFIEDDGGDGAQLVQSLPKWEREARKSQLLGLLQLVDDQYGCWVDEIHTVVSAFHAATELDPRIHARFALQTLSFLYKKLKGRISNQIIAIGVRPNSGNEGDIEEIADPWIVQNERAARHHHPPPVRTRNHHLWRPQRGLPEKSVSVLKAWMFQNFLHPYPKDAEKHVLAVKSGLTRSQVSNWFINARVRLWKPMIEEMYSALNGKEKRLQLEGIDESCSAVLDAVQQRHDDPRSGIC